VLSAASVSPTQVHLSWTPSEEDGPYVVYAIYRDGSLLTWAGPATSFTVGLLKPSTTYTFSVAARDNWSNFSPHSSTVTVTTLPADSSDTTPPTTPGNLTLQDMFCGEVEISGQASTDNVEPQATIRYDIYVNGVFDHSLAGFTRSITYGTVDGENVFTVIAVDSAGSASAPAAENIVLDIC
jgi:chitinase